MDQGRSLMTSCSHDLHVIYELRRHSSGPGAVFDDGLRPRLVRNLHALTALLGLGIQNTSCRDSWPPAAHYDEEFAAGSCCFAGFAKCRQQSVMKCMCFTIVSRVTGGIPFKSYGRCAESNPFDCKNTYELLRHRLRNKPFSAGSDCARSHYPAGCMCTPSNKSEVAACI